jgi:bifunctional UDP-N-acetylglucosamine pyrophosphorylase/glucosamine-1-phosphate N-acetyltransferase
MIVIILAAGKGTRMRPLTNTRLKGSLPIINQALLLRLASMLDQTGIMDKLILVIAPWQLEAMKELFCNSPFASKVEFAIQDPPKGTADAVAQAEQFIDNEQQCLVLNGDILAPIKEIIPKLLPQHEKLGAACTMVVFPGKSKRYGLLQISKDGRVLDIKEKAKSEELTEDIGYINAGIYLFKREVFDAIKKTKFSERGEFEITDTISLLGEEKPIGAIITDNWLSIENPADLFTAQQFPGIADDIVSMKFHSGDEIGFKAAEDIFFEDEPAITFASITISGPVLIGKGTLIEPGSNIGPRVYFGRDCVVAAETTIQNALFFDNCRIGKKSTINRLIAGEEFLCGDNVKINAPENEFVVLGGKTIITTNVEINSAIKLKADSVIKQDTKLKSDY